MAFQEFPSVDVEGLVVRIRMDRIDVIDEVEEQDHAEWQRQVDLATEEIRAVYPTTITPQMMDGLIEEATRRVTRDYPMKRFTVIYVQGRRNPWRVSTPAEEVLRRLMEWNHGWPETVPMGVRRPDELDGGSRYE